MNPVNRYIREMKFQAARFVLSITTLFLILHADLQAQYFGRTKPGYSKFSYSVLQTPHFEIYHYLKNDSLLNTLVRWSQSC